MSRAVWKQHSTLIALVALMVGFELLGRILSYDVKEAFSAWQQGSGSYGDLISTLWSSLTASDLAFLNPRNLTNLTLQVSINGILAVGMTLIILTSGIDLSIGSVVALTGVILGLCDKLWFADMPLASVAMALGAGLVVGGTNGFLISRFKITPFVITLGMLVIARGLALIFSNSSAIAPLSPTIRFMGGGFLPTGVAAGLFGFGLVLLAYQLVRKMRRAGKALIDLRLVLFVILGGAALYVFATDRGLPVPVTVLIVIALLGMLLSQFTTFGRALYAIGGNEHAAILSGIKTPRVKLLVYALMGLLAGVCGVILAGRLNSATPTEGQLLELDAIASVVIGGASLQGGIGRIQGSIIGAFIIGALNNGMDMLEISSNWQMITKGVIIIFAVYSDARLRNVGRSA